MRFKVGLIDYEYRAAVAGELFGRRQAVSWVCKRRSKIAPRLVIKAKLRLKATFPWKAKKHVNR